MIIKISIPTYRKVEADHDKSYTVSVSFSAEEKTVFKCMSSIYDRHLGLKMGYFLV